MHIELCRRCGSPAELQEQGLWPDVRCRGGCSTYAEGPDWATRINAWNALQTDRRVLDASNQWGKIVLNYRHGEWFVGGRDIGLSAYAPMIGTTYPTYDAVLDAWDRAMRPRPATPTEPHTVLHIPPISQAAIDEVRRVAEAQRGDADVSLKPCGRCGSRARVRRNREDIVCGGACQGYVEGPDHATRARLWNAAQDAPTCPDCGTGWIEFIGLDSDGDYRIDCSNSYCGRYVGGGYYQNPGEALDNWYAGRPRPEAPNTDAPSIDSLLSKLDALRAKIARLRD